MNLCIYVFICTHTYIFVYIDMFIRREMIHGVRLDPAKVHQSHEQPSQLYLLQGDMWHYPCGTLCAILRNVSSQHLLLRGFPLAHWK